MAKNEINIGRGIVQPRPEYDLDSREEIVLQLVARDELSCPCCNTPLWGEQIIQPKNHVGVILGCNGCGFREI